MKKLSQVFVYLLGFMLGLYLVVCGLLFIYQRSLIYFPQPRFHADTSALLTLRVGPEAIHVSTRPRNGAKAVLYFGGNAEDVSADVPGLSSAFPESAIYALHYPGYGGSSGTPTQQSIFAAALALFEKVRPDHPEVTVIGRSLGSGVAVWLASQRPVARLVLVTPFDSLADAGAEQFPFVPVRWLLRDTFNSGQYAALVHAPTMIIVAENDEVVPRSSSDRLSKRFAQGLVSYTILPNVGHNTVQTSSLYWSLIIGQ